ncbi:MAG: hypothetical protein M5U07_09410 [Xanthobacteraceae bacterium]|nr:hypothetical protein [Xanthobacteraceae bacterium]
MLGFATMARASHRRGDGSFDRRKFLLGGGAAAGARRGVSRARDLSGDPRAEAGHELAEGPGRPRASAERMGRSITDASGDGFG